MLLSSHMTNILKQLKSWTSRLRKWRESSSKAPKCFQRWWWRNCGTMRLWANQRWAKRKPPFHKCRDEDLPSTPKPLRVRLGISPAHEEDFVIVKVNGKSRRAVYRVGRILHCGDLGLKVWLMCRYGKCGTEFMFLSVNEYSMCQRSDIVKYLSSPRMKDGVHSFFDDFRSCSSRLQ